MNGKMEKKNFLQQFLSYLRLKVLQNEREKKIAKILYKKIKKKKKKKKKN